MRAGKQGPGQARGFLPWGECGLAAPSHPLCPHGWQDQEGPLVPSTALMGTAAWVGTHRSDGGRDWPGTAQSPAIESAKPICAKLKHRASFSKVIYNFRVATAETKSSTGPFMTAAMTLALPAGLCPPTREPDEGRRLHPGGQRLSRGGPKVGVHSVGTLHSNAHMAQKNGSDLKKKKKKVYKYFLHCTKFPQPCPTHHCSHFSRF